MPEDHYGVSGGAVVDPQDTSQQRQTSQGIYDTPPKTELPVNTSSSTPMVGGAGVGSSSMGSSSMTQNAIGAGSWCRRCICSNIFLS